MLIGLVKILFIISAVLFSLLIVLHKYVTKKIKDNVKISNFVAVIGFSLVAYIICAFVLGIFSGGIKYKILMFLFALTPFIIGKTAQYQRIILFSSLQMTIMLISAVIVCVK